MPLVADINTIGHLDGRREETVGRGASCSSCFVLIVLAVTAVTPLLSAMRAWLEPMQVSGVKSEVHIRYSRSKSRMLARTESGRATAMLFVLVALESAWIDFGRLHRSQNADSLLLVLVSLQKWTAFYWQQDRFGMLVPLAASVVRHPLANLLVQGWITTSAALLSPFLAARYLLDDWRDWFPAGAAVNVLLLVLATPEVQFDWFVNQPYGVAFALGCGGLIVLDQRSFAAGTAAAICIVAAHWVNEGVFVLLVPLALCGGKRRSTPLALTMLAIGVLLGALMSSAADAPRTTSALTPLTQWPAGWLELASKAVTVFSSKPALLAALVLSLAGATMAAATGKGRAALQACLACLVVATVYGLIVGTSEWVRLNLYYPRYIFPSLMFLGLAMGVVMLAPFRKYPRVTPCVAGGLLVTITVVTSGAPSLQGIERDFDERFGLMTADVIGTSARVIGGDYWAVWPAVFHANLTLARQGSSAAVYGLAYRSAGTDVIWRSLPAPIFLAAPHDAGVAELADRANVSIVLVHRRPAVDLYRVTPR